MDSVHVKELQAKTIECLREWSSEGKTLMQSAKALGIEGDVIARFETTPSTRSVATPAGGSRRRVRARSSASRRNGGGNGPAVTGEQIVTWLQEHGPANQSMLATAFGTTRQTIAKRLAALIEAGQVERDGQTWKARELATV